MQAKINAQFLFLCCSVRVRMFVSGRKGISFGAGFQSFVPIVMGLGMGMGNGYGKQERRRYSLRTGGDEMEVLIIGMKGRVLGINRANGDRVWETHLRP